MVRLLLVSALLLATARLAAAAPCAISGSNLTVNGVTCTLSGVYTLDTVQVINGGVIQVTPYDGVGSKSATGNLELRAKSITIDATSKISARGAGYSTLICGNGRGPTSTAGGRGGCALRDSGGGGAHFGGGGRGTKDNPASYPAGYEEDCGNSVTYSGTGVPTCSNFADCRNGDGLPTVAGQAFYHSIYQPEFGASGGDKGCRDGDGTTVNVSGAGGGRIVLSGQNGGAGQVTINGTLDAVGRRGCGNGNDSAGGGAGGTILVVGDNVAIGATARVLSTGGLGGDTQGLASDPTGECVAPAQQNTTADDCGGGGGGGIVSILSVNATIDDAAVFNVSGAIGGVSPLCRGEAGGGVGELQISGGYVGEFCDGYDNDLDGLVDESLPDLGCPGVSRPSCVGGVPQICPPDVPACQGPVTDSRARFAVILDTSGSMLGTLPGVPTFGDGSTGHAGVDYDGNGKFDDSRLYKAKSALRNVIAGYPDIDFALARYHQDEALNRSCQTAHNFECNQICCSYDNPQNNTGAAPSPACSLPVSATANVAVLKNSPGDECINYAGSCGPPRRGADVLVGFGHSPEQSLMWLDGKETNFKATQTQGDYCDFATGGDCELRGTGPTPLASSLQAVDDFLTPIKACDLAASGGCRKYGVILLTDGAESCQGDPVAAAAALRAKGINTYVIGFSVLASEQAQLNAIASAGGTGTAFLVGSEDQLANALATIVSGSIIFETCNNLDDDCDGRVDEDFPSKGQACDDGKLGPCLGTGQYVCNATGTGTTCSITAPGATPTPEVCNGRDDNCNGLIDEGNVCPVACGSVEVCNGMDDDCDGNVDENITRACGVELGVCHAGTEVCVAGVFQGCTATGGSAETCNGLDDNCDGVRDGFSQECSSLPGGNPGVGICHPGTQQCPANGPGVYGACLGEVGPRAEACNNLDDDCDGKVDEDTGGADCSSNCGVGQIVCQAGVLMCDSTPATDDATCNNVDDDCDGNIDENAPPGGPCDGGGTVCMGQSSCIGGQYVCQGGSINPESCNCQDDDCDGTVDENPGCPSGSSCTNCQCAFACAAGEFPCPLGKQCKAGFCVADPCFNVTCPPVGGNAQVCQEGACVDACAVAGCAAPLVCQPSTGQCKPDDCTTFPDRCAANQLCVAGTCVTNLCLGVTCPSDKYCVAGNCIASCADVACPDGQRCRLGACEPDPCGHACPFGQTCNATTGTCQPNPCAGRTCPQGQWCNPDDGQCADDPCIGTTCPGSGEICVGGTCYDPAQFQPDAGPAQYVTAGGGGGCATTGDGGLGLLAPLALLGLAARRRRGGRA